MAIEENKGEDIYAELRRTLEAEESVEEESTVATDPKPTEENTSENEITDESGDLSEDEISKLHPKAQKRIKELADEVKRLAEVKAEEAEQSPETPEESPSDEHQFKDVREFLEAVQDEPSRKLLEKFYGVIKSETSSILAPLEQKNNEVKFETEFSKYEKIDGLKDYKNDLKKTFMRNPKQSLKSLVGEVITDLQLNKVKPIEKTTSTPNRGKVDTSNLSKDELYDMLGSLRD